MGQVKLFQGGRNIKWSLNLMDNFRPPWDSLGKRLFIQIQKPCKQQNTYHQADEKSAMWPLFVFLVNTFVGRPIPWMDGRYPKGFSGP